jgi:hypothetical protein
MFYPMDNPPQWLLDGLFAEEKKNSKGSCHDCGVPPGQNHIEGCDVARCRNPKSHKMTQRLGCNCGNCGEDIWTGIWPGIQECYEKKLVCFDTSTNSVYFDLNRLYMTPK